ncbi:MAG: methyltransferase domain-containing protein [Nitrospirae bacterium]|nr:methyltransferase domain-containing protein [Nitrospirota bacterium]
MNVIRPEEVNNKIYYLTGLIIVLLNYIKQGIIGYRKPRSFSINEVERAIEYDINVVDGWLKYLGRYSDEEINPLENKTILELGPGADLGIGLILLMMGAKKYIALDVYPLARSTPVKFYEELSRKLANIRPETDTVFFNEELDKFYKKKSERVIYIVDDKFQISKIKDGIDIVFSQAAFEYFPDMEKTVKELSSVVNSGGVLISEIDLRTHTSAIRDKDPLNIYRYDDFLWNLFKPKSPLNRVRAFEYKLLLEKYGWTKVETLPLDVLEEKYVEKIKPHLSKRFRMMDSSEMKMLSVMLTAQKK